MDIWVQVGPTTGTSQLQTDVRFYSSPNTGVWWTVGEELWHSLHASSWHFPWPMARWFLMRVRACSVVSEAAISMEMKRWYYRWRCNIRRQACIIFRLAVSARLAGNCNCRAVFPFLDGQFYQSGVTLYTMVYARALSKNP